MFGIFKKKKEIEPKHIHDFNKSLGKYYKLYRTEYKNCFDYVCIYERKQCSCGHYKDFKVSSDEFLPSMHHRNTEENEFINLIKEKGIEEEFEINIRTNLYSNRNN